MQNVRYRAVVRDVGPSPAEVISKAYPRIMQQIELLWGTRELQERFSQWLLTDQEDRKGWPLPVYTAMMELSIAHADTYNLDCNPVWDKKPDRW